MRKLHQSSAMQVLNATPRSVRLPGVVRFQAAHAGWLWVDHGRVWITREGDHVDHVLTAGGALYLGRGEQVLAEPWRLGDAAGMRWARARDAQALAALPRPLASATLRAVALGLRGVAGRLVAAARSAEAIASRAQGSMPAGDSIASSGALQ